MRIDPPLSLESEFELLSFPLLLAVLSPAETTKMLIDLHRLNILRQATIDELIRQLMELQSGRGSER